MNPLLRPLLLALCFFAAGCANWAPPGHGEKLVRNVTFAVRDGKHLYLDLYLPADRSRPVPLAIWIHGGGWSFGAKGLRLLIRDLTREGFAVASLDYRLSPAARFPAQIEDCRDGLHFLRQHAAEYGLDRNRIFLAGDSAGGHLAALLGLQEGRSKIRGVFAMYPATDLDGFKDKEARVGFLPWLLGGTVIEKRALARSGSPVNYVTSNAPPFLFMHGDADKTVPLAQSQELHRRLRAAGVESRVEVVKGAPHAFELTPSQLREVADFYRQHSR